MTTIPIRLLIPSMIALVITSTYAMTAEAVTALPVTSPWNYQFSVDGTLNEAGSMRDSGSPYFWLNSGGVFLISGGKGHTQQGRLPTGSTWQKMYEASNSLDTDKGYLPQNLFRFVTRSTWDDSRQEIDFKINKTNLTNTPNRAGYSGILLMSRYQDGNNLYYAGVRHDGTAVIKKKKNGTYTTLGSAKVWSGTYHRTTNPNIIPQNKWMGLRMDTITQPDATTKVTLYIDENNSGSWKKLVEVTDRNPVKGPAHTGIRTDYMDVSFDDYSHKEI
jgi:hypothetical protein